MRCAAPGMHTIRGVPRKIAEFLGLNQPGNYTGHCLRRTGASMVAKSSSSKEDNVVIEKVCEVPDFVNKGNSNYSINVHVLPFFSHLKYLSKY